MTGPWSAARQRLGLLRAWVCVVWLIRVLPDPLEDLARLPRELFNPLGVLNVVPPGWWSTLLSADVLNAAQWTLTGTLLMALCGLGTRPALVFSTVLLILVQGVVRGFGFINHAELPLLMVTVMLCVAPCTETWALWPARGQRHGHHGALLVARLIVVSACCFIGVHRLIYGGVALFGSHTLLHYVLHRTYGMHSYGFAYGTHMLTSAWFYASAHIGFVALTFCEAAAPFALVSRRFARLLVPVLMIAHVLILLTMNIAFWELAALYVVLLERPRGPHPERAPLAPALVAN